MFFVLVRPERGGPLKKRPLNSKKKVPNFFAPMSESDLIFYRRPESGKNRPDPGKT